MQSEALRAIAKIENFQAFVINGSVDVIQLKSQARQAIHAVLLVPRLDQRQAVKSERLRYRFFVQIVLHHGVLFFFYH